MGAAVGQLGSHLGDGHGGTAEGGLLWALKDLVWPLPCPVVLGSGFSSLSLSIPI